ncbi:MAG: YggT family protein [Porticoccaceae bacterium]|nr:YggT family protein [Porticoccaceae bacterium]
MPLGSMALNLVDVILHLYSLLLLVRLLLQWVQADFFNPLSQAVFKLTAPLVEPLHRLFPTLGTFNSAALIGAILVKWLHFWVLIGVGRLVFEELPNYLIVAVFGVFSGVIEIYFWGILAVSVASWLDAANHPHIQLINQIIDPYLKPFRRIIPPIGILDISSMVAIIGLILVRDRILPMLEIILDQLLF